MDHNKKVRPNYWPYPQRRSSFSDLTFSNPRRFHGESTCGQGLIFTKVFMSLCSCCLIYMCRVNTCGNQILASYIYDNISSKWICELTAVLAIHLLICSISDFDMLTQQISRHNRVHNGRYSEVVYRDPIPNT